MRHAQPQRQPQTSDSLNLARYPGQPQPQTDPRMLAILDGLNGASHGAPSTHDSPRPQPQTQAHGQPDTDTHRITDSPRCAQPPGDTGRSSDSPI